jgi:hypothetical protein
MAQSHKDVDAMHHALDHMANSDRVSIVRGIGHVAILPAGAVMNVELDRSKIRTIERGFIFRIETSEFPELDADKIVVLDKQPFFKNPSAYAINTRELGLLTLFGENTKNSRNAITSLDFPDVIEGYPESRDLSRVATILNQMDKASNPAFFVSEGTILYIVLDDESKSLTSSELFEIIKSYDHS